MNKDLIGRYNEDGTRHEPEKLCIITCKPYDKKDVVTISLALAIGRKQSFYFRATKSLWNKLTEEEKNNYESSIIDNI